MKHILAYKYRCYPIQEQIQLFAHTFGCCRFVYNRMLKHRTEGWHNGERIGFHETSKELTKIKATQEFSWLRDVSSVALQQSLRHLQAAFDNFFAKKSNYPIFKKKRGKQSFTLASSGFTYNPKNRLLKIAKMKEALKIKWSRPLSFIPTSITISKDQSNRYFISFCGEKEIESLPKNEEVVGIDMGLHHFAALSNGEVVEHPKYLKKYLSRLKMLQQRLSRRTKGGKNYEKTRLQLAKLYAKITDCRKDFIHKFTTNLIKRFGHIITEDLAIRDMVKNHCLAQGISDSSWGEVFRQLEYKAKWYGRKYTQIDRYFPSSKRCHKCGYILEKLDLSARSWKCPSCFSLLERDFNASMNIKAVGLTATDCGHGQRKLKHSVLVLTDCAVTSS